MKIRKCFVPNSSSASFILVGHNVTVDDVIANPDDDYMCMGKWICDGQDVFNFTPEYAKLVKVFGWDGYTIVRTLKYSYDCDSVEVTEPATVWGGKADQHSTCDLDGFMDQYIDTENILQEYIKEKLNDIQCGG